MEIQKEKKLFNEYWHENNLPFDGEEVFKNYAWDAWQAAKAVPEGFVLVPREPTDEMIEAFSDGYMDSLSVDFKGASRDGYKAMIEAQEQGHE